MIKLFEVTKKYGSFTAVNAISLTVQEGQIFGFLGINGAGKTTTLRMLAGILQPTSGVIEIAGFDLAKEPLAAKSQTGYIPDRPHLYNKLTGREFLYFCADLYRVNPRSAELRIDKLIEQYSLVAWQDELIESYSHGMKQRLVTCSALIHEPKVLVIDEPMVGLDPHGARLLKQSLRQYAKQGMTIFLSTHSLNVAEEVADNLAIIHNGLIIATGTLADIQRQACVEGRLEDVFIQITSEPEPAKDGP